MAKDAVKSETGERRVALGERRRVAEMSPEEMRRELLTSEVTGLPNRRAFREAGARGISDSGRTFGRRARRGIGRTGGRRYAAAL